MMGNVLFNYVVNGIVIEGPMSYASVLERTGLTDTVGLTELGYIEHMPTVEAPEITKEQVDRGMRNLRNYLLLQSDWTQIADAPLTEQKKTAWATYRQELRNVPAVNADVTTPADIIWPVVPE
jgi:hypothetical protein